ncbi:PmrA [Streptomyces tendae]
MRSGTFISMLLARSCHISVLSLERNARPGVDAVARQVARPGLTARRKR